MAGSDTKPPGGSDKALQEFLAESQEIVDAFNQTLLEIDRQRGERDGQYDPDLINAAFRGVHSLKGLSGLFGFSQMIELSHQLETLMDQMRLGKVPVRTNVEPAIPTPRPNGILRNFRPHSLAFSTASIASSTATA